MRLPRTLLVAAVAAASLGPAGSALAQDRPTFGEDPSNPPAEPEKPGLIAPLLTLYKGKIVIAGETLQMNLSADDVAAPISVAPSLWYGATDKLTVGLTHDFGTTPWTPRPVFRGLSRTVLGMETGYLAGTGICLTGTDNGCPRPYDNLGVDVLHSLKVGRLAVASHPGIDVGSFDPFFLDVRIGILGTLMVTPKLALVFDPRLQIGLTSRDEGNTEAIDLPVWVWYEINNKVSAYLHSGLRGTFDGFGDNYAIPVGIGASYKVNYKLTAGLDFAFTRVNDSLDGRALGLRVMYAL
jgi:hypothetical protein